MAGNTEYDAVGTKSSSQEAEAGREKLSRRGKVCTFAVEV